MANAISLKTKLATPRFEETRDWYRDLFDLAVLEQWDEPDDKGCILGLSGGNGEAFLEICRGVGPSSFSGLSLQFRVGEMDRFPVPDEPRFTYRGPEQRPWGSRYIFLTDPNGVSVVIFSGTSL